MGHAPRFVICMKKIPRQNPTFIQIDIGPLSFNPNSVRRNLSSFSFPSVSLRIFSGAYY